MVKGIQKSLDLSTGVITESEIDIIDSETTEQKLNNLRNKRNEFLSGSDWVVIKEREEGGSVSNFADWKKYRQKLRDITKTYKSLDKVKWPTAPSE